MKDFGDLPNERRAFQCSIAPSSRRKGRHQRVGSHSIRPVIHVPPSAASKSLVQQ
jgi:hypothetical protein